MTVRIDAAVILVVALVSIGLAASRRILVVGQKSGLAWGIDAETGPLEPAAAVLLGGHRVAGVREEVPEGGPACSYDRRDACARSDGDDAALPVRDVMAPVRSK